MTDNTTNSSEADTGSGSAIIALDSPDEAADVQDEFAEIDDLPDDLIETGEGSRGSGGSGFAGVALAVVSLTTNWTSSVVVSHAQYSAEMNAPSSGLTAQQALNMYADGSHTQGWWALVFAAAAVLFGASALLVPRIRGGRTPGWAKAAATGAIVVGLVGALLAVLTITGVFAGHLVAPATSS